MVDFFVTAVDPCQIDDGRCDGFCLTNDAIAQCFCPSGFVLADDRRACLRKLSSLVMSIINININLAYNLIIIT